MSNAVRCVSREVFLEHRKRIREWLGKKRAAQLAGRDEDLLLAIERREIDRWIAQRPNMSGLWAVPYCAPELAEAAQIPEPTKPARAPAPANTKIRPARPKPRPAPTPDQSTKVPPPAR